MALNYCSITLNGTLVSSKTDLCGIMGWFSGTAGWPPCPIRPLNSVRSGPFHNGFGNLAVDNLKRLLLKTLLLFKKEKKKSEFEEDCLSIKLLTRRGKLHFKSPGHSSTLRGECLI